MKKRILTFLLLSQAVLWGSISGGKARQGPSLDQKYSTLQKNYNDAEASLAAEDLRPLSQFSQNFAGCYWVIKNVLGVYRDDVFVLGIADYHLHDSTGAERTWRGPAVVFDYDFPLQDDVSLDSWGMTDFPEVEHSDDEGALAIRRVTHVPGNDQAVETQYLRQRSDETVAMKTIFTMSGRTATGYGYCWKSQSHRP
jgi:hypothetical protein